MVEVVVGPVIEKLIDLLHDEAKLFAGVEKAVDGLKSELESITCFLKDAELKSEKEATSESVKIWVKQVREEANHIEDVIDDYIRHVSPRRDLSGFNGFLRKVYGLFQKVKERYKIASEIKDIKASLRDIKERSDRYKIESSLAHGSSGKNDRPSNQLNTRFDSKFIEEHEVVGIDSTREELQSMLVEGKPSRGVISLVGTGGIGKTTLANQVYENEAVKKLFSSRAWITVSQTYDMKKLLKSLIKQTCVDSGLTNSDEDDIQELIKSLREYLKTKRYIVVIDDVWEEDFWEVIKNAFPNNDKGSRVVLTTRKNRIAVAACQEEPGDIVYKIKPLSHEMALSLFHKKAFQSRTSQPNCPEELEDLSSEIVRKCQGLPLVITAIACLMATKEKSMFEWQRVLDNMRTEIEGSSKLTSALKILSLSYNDLPDHLKRCLLYFGIFPEDYSISDTRLSRLWIAEGFLKPQMNKTLEEVGKEYVDELIHRNLVESSYWECRQTVKMCKVHDMMREVILLKGNEIGFCQILDKKNKIFKKKYRRLSINGDEENAQGIAEDSTVRSVFVFNVDKLSKTFLVSLFKKFKLLRVLEFRHSPLDYLPSNVGNLFHLKYLGLQCTKLKKLPKSVGKLQNLQTLDLHKTLVRKLRFKISNLRHMRHFFHFYCDKSVNSGLYSIHDIKMPWKIGSLENLQTLSHVLAEDIESIKELEKLRDLRKISVEKMTTESGKAVCASISKMAYLENLSLSLIRKDETLDLESISSPPRVLSRLVLTGSLLKLPHWISELHKLLELRLFLSNLHDDPLQLIGCLPNLQRLTLHEAYNGGQLHFKQGSFPKLKALRFASLGQLEDVEIDRGALPCLEMLEIEDVPLKSVPYGIEHLTNLKTLRLINMAEEFVLTIRPEGGADYGKVMHVSSLTLWTSKDGHATITRLRDSDPLNLCCAEHFPKI